eukprot:6174086-Alexandrium_andersonii.AAC.1
MARTPRTDLSEQRNETIEPVAQTTDRMVPIKTTALRQLTARARWVATGRTYASGHRSNRTDRWNRTRQEPDGPNRGPPRYPG